MLLINRTVKLELCFIPKSDRILESLLITEFWNKRLFLFFSQIPLQYLNINFKQSNIVFLKMLETYGPN